jgi:hypothetical protein
MRASASIICPHLNVQPQPWSDVKLVLPARSHGDHMIVTCKQQLHLSPIDLKLLR